ncbi:MAG: hypothetical protein F6J87_28075 [Spirulina sp. SIO3F2]|nr:hypothetical protein [Spirulina sp. SIO3F2]
MSVFLSFLKISPESLELLRLYPETGKLLFHWDEIENPEHWEPIVKVIVSKQGVANLKPVHSQIPQLIRELQGQSAESLKDAIWFLPEEFETVATSEEIKYLVSIGSQGHRFVHIDSYTTYWTTEEVSRIAGIISRVKNPYSEAYTEIHEDEVDPFTYIIDTAKNGYAMLLTVC